MRGLGLSALLLVALVACVPRNTPSPGPGQVEVEMVDDAFQPDILRLPAGTTVVFANRGQRAHTATEASGLFDSGVLAPGDRYRFIFATPGQYTVYCRLHPYMVLHLQVVP